MKLEGGDDGTDKQKEEELNLPNKKSGAESTENKEEQQKKKADDLWASFLSEVGPRPTAENPGLQQVGDSQVFYQMSALHNVWGKNAFSMICSL